MQGVKSQMLKHTFIVLAAMGVGLMGLTSQASAATLQAQQPAIQTENSSLRTEVNDHRRGNRGQNNYYQGKNRYKSYNRFGYGNRCGSWSNNCRYRHGGYYYQNPWWLVGAGIAISGAYAYNDGYYGGRAYGGYRNNHVSWCLNRYRSYNPRSNTWVSYSGYVRQCISPYGP